MGFLGQCPISGPISSPPHPRILVLPLGHSIFMPQALVGAWGSRDGPGLVPALLRPTIQRGQMSIRMAKSREGSRERHAADTGQWEWPPRMWSEGGQGKDWNGALAGVAQWTDCRPVNQRVSGSIPIWAHAWVVGQIPSWGCARGNCSMCLSHTNVSLHLFLPPFLLILQKSRNKILKKTPTD